MPEPSPSTATRVMATCYDACVRLADGLDAHRLLVAAVGAPLIVAGLASLNQWVLLGFPNSGDEYVYLLQARTLAAGRLWWPSVSSPDLFATNYVAAAAGRTFGTFPPGWPLALALAMAAGLPPWLVNPLVGTASLALVWTLGAQLHSPRVGVLAAVLVAISPFFLFNAASYFSHPFCGALLLGAACLASRHDRRAWWVPVAVGWLVGWAVLARYFTGAVCAVPIVWWLVRPGVSRTRTLALVGLGGLPWMLALLAYNAALTGSPWRLTTTELTVTRWFADGVVLRGADILASHVLRHLLWTPPVLVAAYAFYLWRGASAIGARPFTWLPAAMAAALYFYMERGGNQYGARFHYEVFPFLVLVVTAQVFRAPGYEALARRDRLVFGLLAASVAAMPAAFVTHAAIERAVILERMDPFTDAAAGRLDDALVFIGGRVGTDRSMAARDLTRNSPRLDDDVIFGLDPGPAARCAAAARVPGRTAYVYRWDVAADDGALTRLRCP